MATYPTDDDTRVDSGVCPSIMVVPRLHLRLKTPTAEEHEKIETLREAVRQTPFWSHPQHRTWLTDSTLLRFLIARDFSIEKAMEMLSTALTWRDLREPYVLTASLPQVQEQGATGKIYNAGFDRWHRPVVIFNNSVNKSNDTTAQMRYLAYNLETALRRAKRLHPEEGVCKFVIFMHMTDFSLFNCPPFKVTRETIQIVTTCFPETMGHCVIFNPPFAFSAFFDSVKRFIDKRTASKIVMLSGDVSEGSVNDLAMKELLGNDWKSLTGAEQARLREGCSPGFDPSSYWPSLVREEEEAEREDEATRAAAAAAAARQKVPVTTPPLPPPSPSTPPTPTPSSTPTTTTTAADAVDVTAAAAAAAAAAAPPHPSSFPPSPPVPPLAPPTAVGKSISSRPASPNTTHSELLPSRGGGGGREDEEEGKLWHTKSSMPHSRFLAITALVLAAAAFLCVHAEDEGRKRSSSSSSSSSSSHSEHCWARSSSSLPPSPSSSSSSTGGPPGEWLLLLSLLALTLSILLTYPNPTFHLEKVWEGGRKGRRKGQGADKPLPPLPGAVTKTIVTSGRALAAEARRRK